MATYFLIIQNFFLNRLWMGELTEIFQNTHYEEYRSKDLVTPNSIIQFRKFLLLYIKYYRWKCTTKICSQPMSKYTVTETMSETGVGCKRCATNGRFSPLYFNSIDCLINTFSGRINMFVRGWNNLQIQFTNEFKKNKNLFFHSFIIKVNYLIKHS